MLLRGPSPPPIPIPLIPAEVYLYARVFICAFFCVCGLLSDDGRWMNVDMELW
jgi:hypothetical protein